jgi:hypothetical protein
MPGAESEWRSENIDGIARLHATADGVISLSENGVPTGHAGALTPSGLKPAGEIAAAGHIVIARSADGSAIAWGADVEDGPQRFRMDAETRHCRISPAGLVVSW